MKKQDAKNLVDDNIFNSRRVLAKNWIKRISTKQTVRCCEIGCGLGFITSDLTKEGITCIGIDISPTAIEKPKIFTLNVSLKLPI